ncbi:MAG: ABC transporter permease [Bdellovibrionales bacterium]|nr:ABC transporter permease [Bdellovibrionales bacterium]
MITRMLAKGWLILWFGGTILYWAIGSPATVNVDNALAKPNFFNLPGGADTYGRNLLLVLSQASLLSFIFALTCVFVITSISLLVAGLSPNLPARISRGIEWIIQLLLAFPSLLFAIMIAGFLGPGKTTMALALVLGGTPWMTRVLWVRAREISQQEFVWAARSLGAGPFRLATKHYLPHLLSLATVKIPSMLAQAIMTEASLSFLGLGFPIGQESWGSLLAQARDYLIEAPHISIVVGVPLFLSLLSLEVISKPAPTELV